MKILIYLVISIFAIIFLFLIALLFSHTKISGEASRTDSKSDARILINFLRNVLTVRFDLVDGRKHMALFLVSWKIYQKELAGGERRKSKSKAVPRQKKKGSLQKKLLVLQSYWQPGKRFLKNLLVQFKYFKLDGAVNLGLGSPSKTGLFYGYWLATKEFIPASSLTVHPEFLKKEISGWISTDVQVRLVGLVKTAIPFWLKIRKIK